MVKKDRAPAPPRFIEQTKEQDNDRRKKEKRIDHSKRLPGNEDKRIGRAEGAPKMSPHVSPSGRSRGARPAAESPHRRKNEVFFSHPLDKSSKFRYSSRPALQNAAVAQLDRVSGYEPEGRGFESCQPRHTKFERRSGREVECTPLLRVQVRIRASGVRIPPSPPFLFL